MWSQRIIVLNSKSAGVLVTLMVAGWVWALSGWQPGRVAIHVKALLRVTDIPTDDTSQHLRLHFSINSIFRSANSDTSSHGVMSQVPVASS